MNLVIVESPTKARTLSRFLGGGFEIMATMGHVKDLPKSKLGIDVEHDFKPDYQLVKEREKTIEELKKAAKKVRLVYLAMDPDREGEAIAYHVKELLGKDGKFKRIVFHEITKAAIEAALKQPGRMDLKLVAAQQARRVLDRLVGYKLSPLLWRKIRRGLSAGRVQSVVVRLIVEREHEIEAFKPEEYWLIEVELKKGKGSLLVRLVKIGDKKAQVENKKQAEQIVADLRQSKYQVAKVEKKELKRYPWPPLMTSTLQQASYRFSGFSSRKTMSLAQKLYEEGLITYHRTDSLNIARGAVARVRTFIDKRYGRRYLPEEPRVYKTKSRLAQEAHEAIRPTKVTRLAADLGKGLRRDHQRLYGLIWRRFVACQMSEAVYEQTKIKVLARKSADKDYWLQASGLVERFDGWRKVIGRGGREEELLAVEEGENLKLGKVKSEQKFTEPPPRYTEASLVKALEERGIGRPSTYAPTISTIQTRQYVEKKDGKFLPTPVGVTVNKFLEKNFDKVVDYGFTAGMEDSLDGVAQGKEKWVPVIREFYGPFSQRIESVMKNSGRVKIPTEKTGRRCPECKKGNEIIRVGRFGKFLSCSRFPECKYTANFVEKLEGVKCPECGGEVIVRQTKKRRRFYGCSNYPKCKWASWRKPEAGKK